MQVPDLGLRLPTKVPKLSTTRQWVLKRVIKLLDKFVLKVLVKAIWKAAKKLVE